jgi:hypothetical protein
MQRKCIFLQIMETKNGKFQKQIYLLNHINANELTGRIIPSGMYRPSADFYY